MSGIGTAQLQQAGPRPARDERGVAMISVLLVMVLLILLAVGAIEISEQEMKAGGRSRAAGNILYAAEAGVDFALNRLRPPRDLSAFSFTVEGDITVQSRSRDDSSAQPIATGGIGQPPDGYSINVGSGFVNETFQVNVTAGGVAKPSAEIEVKVGLLTPNSGTE